MPIRGIQIRGQSLPKNYGSRDIVCFRMHDANFPIIVENRYKLENGYRYTCHSAWLLTGSRLWAFRIWRRIWNYAHHSGEMGMTSRPVIEKRPLSRKPLHIGVSLILTSNRKSLVRFRNMRSDFIFGDPQRWNRHDVISGYRTTLNNTNCLGNETANITVIHCKLKIQCKSH